MHEVAFGSVDRLAAQLLAVLDQPGLLVALGGGRVIDTAKAIAAARPGIRVAAIPTTLSGAEMTNVHMHAAGVAADTPRMRPAIVINDPALSASQPPHELARSAANALGHAVDGPLTPLASPVSTLAALQSVQLLGRCFAPGAAAVAPGALGAQAQDELALAALLAGYVIGTTWYGLHHVLSQTLRRVAGLGHGEANAIMLPHSLTALERRAPDWIARLQETLGEPPGQFAERLAALGRVSTLQAAGVAADLLPVCVQAAAARYELELTPPRAQRDELEALYRAAW